MRRQIRDGGAVLPESGSLWRDWHATKALTGSEYEDHFSVTATPPPVRAPINSAGLQCRKAMFRRRMAFHLLPLTPGGPLFKVQVATVRVADFSIEKKLHLLSVTPYSP
jgi:hypothetical protein